MWVLLNFFALVQAVGAIIGAGGSVVGELAYLKAMQDGRIDGAERRQLAIIARALRYGMILLLLGSIALVLADYSFSLPFIPALTTSYWLLMTLALVVIYFSWALSRRKVAFWLGSAAVFTGWWCIVFLTIGYFPELSYGASIVIYVVATAFFAALLSYARMLTART